MIDLVFLGFDFIQVAESVYGNFICDLGEVVTDQIYDCVVFVDLLRISLQFLFCIGQFCINGAFHGVGMNYVVFDFDEALGGVDHELIMVEQFVGSSGPVKDFF